MASPVLRPGRHAWVWPLPANPNVWEKTCNDAKSLGLAGLIPQQGLDAPAWAARKPAEGARKPSAVAESYDLQFTLGLGMDGHNAWADSQGKLVDAIGRCLDYSAGVMLNWESAWDNDAADPARAVTFIDSLIAKYPTCAGRLTDAPWWAPLFIEVRNGTRVKRVNTHPHAPMVQFGRVCTGLRFVQAYGANGANPRDGRSGRMLAWARDPSQYPSLGTPAAQVAPAFQMYRRSVTDHVRAMEGESTVCLWDVREMDRECRAALQYLAAIEAQGFRGPGASMRFQVAHNIKGPGVVGPQALAAAGVAAPKGLRFSAA